MDALPDEVLLQVLALLDVRQVLAVRLVCRRLRDLAMHADLWRRRSLDTYFHPVGVVKAVLRLAPCLGVLHLSGDTGLSRCGVLAATTQCAVSHLKLHLLVLEHCEDVVHVVAALVLRNQVALGRLRCLTMQVRLGWGFG